jgi:outer membrane beta-barrel protein
VIRGRQRPTRPRKIAPRIRTRHRWSSNRAWNAARSRCRRSSHGLRADYHITEDFFLEGTAGKATGGKTSFETLGGNVQLLSDAERQFTYYNLSLGYNFLPGEVFIGRNLVLTSGLYLLGGVGSTKFAGDQHFTVNFGAGFRVLPTDWLAFHIDAQDLVFKSDLLGVDRLKNNLQVHLGATVFF